MVLQDVSDNPPDSFSNDPYPSDNLGNDSYASPSSPGHRFDASQLPRPLPILSPFLGYSDNDIRIRTDMTLKFAEQKIHRSLTPDESQALALHLYSMEQKVSYAQALGIAAGTWRWYNTMATNKYPMFQSKPNDINPNKFLFISGPRAKIARHSWRLFLYASLAGGLGKLIGQAIAQPAAARESSSDPKLARFSADLKAAVSSDHQKAREMAQYRRDGVPIQKSPDGTPALPPHAGAPRSWARRAPAPSPAPAAADDDMSPTAGSDPWPTSDSTAYGESAFSPDASSQQQRQPAQPAQQNYPYRSQSTRPLGDDDASPTGGMFQDDIQNASKPRESAWERLRRGGGSSPPPSRQAPHRSEGDGFTFGGTDDERQKAQREFDERIEQEMHGRNFNEDKKW